MAGLSDGSKLNPATVTQASFHAITQLLNTTIDDDAKQARPERDQFRPAAEESSLTL